MCKNLNFAISNSNNVVKDFMINTGDTEMLSGLVETYDKRHLSRIQNEALQHNKSQNFNIQYVQRNRHCNKTWNLRQDGYFLKDNYKNNNPITFVEWFKNNIDINYPNPIYIYWNAIFAVKKENIINKPIEYYKKLILEVNYHINPIEGHFFERAWYYVFDTPISVHSTNRRRT